jgi:hypothetical protein
MGFQPARLRQGEAIVGVAAVVLLVVLFALPWYGLTGGIGRAAATLGLPTSVNGYHGLTTLRWLILVTVVAGLALTYFQGSRSAPALPVSLSVIVTTLGVLTSLCLIYRVLISLPGPDSLIEARAGAYVGLACALAVAYGGYRSLRQEDRPDPQRNAAIPTVELESRR